MKKMKSVLSITLAVLSLASCGGKGNVNRDKEQVDEKGNWTGGLNIGIFKGGFGSEYMQAVCDGFHAKNPGVTVKLNIYEDRSKISTDMQSSDALQDNDIYFSETNDVFRAANIDNAFATSDHKEALVELSDVYNTINEGEKVAVKDKINDNILNYCTNQWGNRKGSRYLMSYGITVAGVAYNRNVVKPYLTDNTLPRTTDEFYNLCEKVLEGEKAKDKSFYPIVYAAGNTAKQYWQEPYYYWWSQYDGQDKFTHFFQGRAYDEESNSWIHSRDVFALEGRREAFTVAAKFLDYKNGFTNPSSMTGYSHFDAQTYLLANHSAFMMNSGWLENEMTMSMFTKEQIAGVLGMMKYPVISSLIKELPSVNDDATLANVVQAIDEGKTYENRGEALKDVTENDYDRVYEARHTTKVGATVNFGVIPTSAKNQTLAKKFLAYLYSDDGIKRYSECTPGCFLPIKNFDYDSIDAIKNTNSTFLKDCISLMKEKNYIWPYANNSIVYNGNLDGVYLGATLDNSLELAFGSKDPMTPDAAYNRLIEEYQSQSKYDELMASADK